MSYLKAQESRQGQRLDAKKKIRDMNKAGCIPHIINLNLILGYRGQVLMNACIMGAETENSTIVPSSLKSCLDNNSSCTLLVYHQNAQWRKVKQVQCNNAIVSCLKSCLNNKSTGHACHRTRNFGHHLLPIKNHLRSTNKISCKQ